MSKISALPIAETLNGSETVPMVQNGKTVQGNIGDHIGSLSQPYLDQTKAARDIAQAAVGVSYLSEAAALSGSVDGDKFTYWDGDNIVFAENDTGVIVPLPGPWFERDKVGERTVSQLLASNEAARGPGSRYNAGGHRYVELDASIDQPRTADPAGYDVRTASGVPLRVLPANNGVYQSAAFGLAPSGVDDEAIFDIFLAALDGATGVVNAVPVVPFVRTVYRGNTLAPVSNSNLVLEPGVDIIGKASGGARIFQLRDIENFTLTAYGATIEHLAVGVSSALYIDRAKNLIVEGLRVKGPGLGAGEADAIYIGGDPANDNVSENITLRHVTAYHARRNVISIVSCHGGHYINCDFSETLVGGVLRKVVDIEPNRWMANGLHTVINQNFIRCSIHNGVSDGIANQGGVGITTDNCDIFDIAAVGFKSSQWSNIFDGDKGIPVGCRLGVISIDSATGWITVHDTANITDDFGIRPGMWFVKGSRNGGALPAEMNTSYMVIEDIDATQKKIKVSQSWGWNIINSTTGTGSAGTGSFSVDPDVSSIWFGVYKWEDDVNLNNTRIYDVAEQAVEASITSKFTIDGGMYETDNAFHSVKGIYVRNFQIVGSLTCIGGTSSGRGIELDRCSESGIGDGVVLRGFKKAGLYIVKSSGTEVGTILTQGCGASETFIAGGASVIVDQSSRVNLSPKVRNSLAKQATYGVYCSANTSYCLVHNADGYSAGSTNANTYNMGGVLTNRVANSRVKDGSWHGTGSVTYDPPSLADGTGVTTTVSVTGAALGMAASVGFSASLQGITMTAFVSSAGTVSVRLQNETGGTIDLASGTLRALAA